MFSNNTADEYNYNNIFPYVCPPSPLLLFTHIQTKKEINAGKNMQLLYFYFKEKINSLFKNLGEMCVTGSEKDDEMPISL